MIHRPRGSVSNGFALIELSVVIALMIIIMVLTFQGFTFFHRMAVHAELDTIYTHLLAASRRAAVDHEPHIVTFDQTKNAYSSVHRIAHNNYQLSADVTFGLLPGVKGPPAQPKSLVRNPITFEKQRIILHPDGKIQPGTIYITDAQKRWQYALSVPVGTVSHLRRYRYSHAQWEQIA